MKYSAKLKKQRAEAIEKAGVILKKAEAENRVMTEAEQKDFDALHATADGLKPKIVDAEKQEAAEAEVNTPQPTLSVDQQPGDLPPAAPAARPKLPAQVASVRTKYLKSPEMAYRFCVWLAFKINQVRGDLNGWARQRAHELFNVGATAQGEGSNVYGGNLVPDEFLPSIIDLRDSYGVARQNTRIIPMSRDSIKIPRNAGNLSAYFVGESVAGTQSNKTWDQVSLTLKKLAVLAVTSKELAEDAAVAIGDLIAFDIAWALANKEDDCAFNGDGSSTYGGITGFKNALAAGSIKSGSGNAWSALTMGDFDTLDAALPAYAFQSPNLAYFCSSQFFAAVMRRLAYGAAGNTAVEYVQGTNEYKFRGRRVAFTQAMPQASASGAIGCYLGDLGVAAKFGAGREMMMEVSTEATVNGTSLFEADQIGFKGTERFDYVVHERGTSTVGGPVVALKTT